MGLYPKRLAIVFPLLGLVVVGGALLVSRPLPVLVTSPHTPSNAVVPRGIAEARGDLPTLMELVPETGPARVEGERHHYERYKGMAARQPGVLERAAASLLRGPAEDCEKVALLRALRDSGSPALIEALDVALGLPDQGPPGCESVPSFALRMLGQRMGTEEPVRRFLEKRIWEETWPAPDLRRRAAAALFGCAPVEEVFRQEAALYAEQDTDLVVGTLSALWSRSDREDWSPFIERVSWQHPNEAVRRQVMGMIEGPELAALEEE